MQQGAPDHLRPVATGSAAVASALATALAVIAALAVAALFTVWPALTGVLIGLVVVFVLAVRAPAIALVVAIGAVGAEGTIKILLTNEPLPLSVTPDAFGAGALDLALFGTLIAVLAADRGSSLRELWEEASRPERAVIMLFALWLCVSVPQIFQSGATKRGLEGFRLIQAYVFVAFGGAVAFVPRRGRGWLVTALLVAFAFVSGYAALRALLGPAAAERTYALSKQTVAQYGGVFRAVGSFSSSVGMDSYLAPAAAFAAALAFLSKRRRPLAALVFIFSAIAIGESYGRTPLVATVVGLACLAVLALIAPGQTRRRKVVVIAGVIGVLVVGAGGIALLSRSSADLRTRLHGLVDPAHDRSIQDRLNTWSADLREVSHYPMGRGLGTVGSASRSASVAPRTTDNSYLEVLVEQGIPVEVVFLLAMVGAVVAIARRLRRASGERYTVGVAALCGFVAFVALLPTGEFIEQPGKVVGWLLLGIAAAQALGRHPARAEAASDQVALRHGEPVLTANVRG